jgi:integrase
MAARRATPLFSGPLAEEFEQFLDYRRGLRTAHEHLVVALCHLDRFLLGHASKATELDPDVIRLWLRTLEGRKAQTIGNYQRVARQFCEFRRRSNPGVYVPPKWRVRRDATFRPYIFSEMEIAGLLEKAAQLSGGLRPHTIRLLIVLLYTAGLRISEPVRLRLRDYDKTAATLHIERSKFGKTRVVPLAWAVAAKVNEYLDRRRDAGGATSAEAPLLINSHRRAYSVVSVQHIINNLLRDVCAKPACGRGGPRVHDIRHSMACRRLLCWYRDGLDVNARLPLLATYLGHRDFASTQAYLAPTAELLAEANARFYAFGRSIVAEEDDDAAG